MSTPYDLHRYDRQTRLPEMGQDGQRALQAGRVLCVGAGGLGSPALQYLVAAGVGTIGIIDHDRVDESNLQRQIVFKETDIGQSKASAARANLLALNSQINITAYDQPLTAQSCADLFPDYDVIIDATDNFATKFLINDAAVKFNKPWVYGSILGFSGQMAVFDPRQEDAPCYRCVFPEPPTQNIMNCAQAGVIGAIAGVMGTMQALEVIKLLVGHPDCPPMTGQFLQLNLANHEKTLTLLAKEPKCKACSREPNDIELEDLDMMSQTCAVFADDITIEQTRQKLPMIKPYNY